MSHYISGKVKPTFKPKGRLYYLRSCFLSQLILIIRNKVKKNYFFKIYYMSS